MVTPTPINPAPVGPAPVTPAPAVATSPPTNSTGAAVASGSAEMGNLAASFARVRLAFTASDIGTADFTARVRQAIDEAITRGAAAGKQGWIDIYEARRLNILLLGPDELSQALITALQQLVDDKVAAGPALQKAFDDLKVAAAGVPQSTTMQPRLRLLLLDIVEAIQWNEEKRYLTRRKTREAANRIVWCWAVTFVLFIAPYVYALITYYYHPETTFERWSAVVPWTVLAAGLMGALFSRLIYLQSNWTSLSLDQVEDAKLWSSILLRGSVGMCAAVVVFLFLRSGIIKGSLFPDFTQVGLNAITGNPGDPVDKVEVDKNLGFLVPTLGFALLIIWCFIAGFFERFVPDILAATEKKLSVAAAK